MLGVEHQNWPSTTILALETSGADSLATSLHAGHLITLPEITSMATSLGAKRVSAKTFELAQHEAVKSVVLTDADVARACCRFADDERLLVEMACGASVAVCYDGCLRNILPHLTPESKVVVVVCGGSNISLETLADYRQRFGSEDKVVLKDAKCAVPSALTAQRVAKRM